MTFDGPLLGGRWRLGPRLGHGGQADTFLARDERSPSAAERVVVVKQLHLTRRAASGWKPFDLFEREVRTLKALRHPGVPRYLDSFESEPGVFNLVMERAPGATLWAYRKKVRFNDGELRDILVKTLDILAYLHGLNPPVVHRDIKPTNLVRSPDGRVSLIDFGGVRDALRADGGSTVIGTFGYMAPEQLHGEASPATDLHGLGATLIALAGDVEPEKVPRAGLRMDLVAHLPHMDPHLRSALAAMTAPDPADRPKGAAGVLALLQAPPAAPGSAVAPRPRETMQGPGREAGRAPAAGPHELVTRVVDEITEFTGELPAPLRILMLMAVFLVGVSGYLALTVLRLAFLPIAFAIADAAASEKRRHVVAAYRREIERAVDEGRSGMRALVRGRRRAELPPASEPDPPAGRAGFTGLRARRRRRDRRG